MERLQGSISTVGSTEEYSKEIMTVGNWGIIGSMFGVVWNVGENTFQ